MLYEFKTKLTPQEVINRAVDFFGQRPGGIGLDITEQTECCVVFVGGGGHVRVTASAEEKSTRVEIETREWDNQVKQFMRKMAK